MEPSREFEHKKNLYKFVCNPETHLCDSRDLIKRDHVDWDTLDKKDLSVMVFPSYEEKGRISLKKETGLEPSVILPQRYFQEQETCNQHCAALPELGRKAIQTQLTHKMIGDFLNPDQPVSPAWSSTNKQAHWLSQSRVKNRPPGIAEYTNQGQDCFRFFGTNDEKFIRSHPYSLKDLQNYCLTYDQNWLPNKLLQIHQNIVESKSSKKSSESNSVSDSEFDSSSESDDDSDVEITSQRYPTWFVFYYQNKPVFQAWLKFFYPGMKSFLTPLKTVSVSDRLWSQFAEMLSLQQAAIPDLRKRVPIHLTPKGLSTVISSWLLYPETNVAFVHEDTHLRSPYTREDVGPNFPFHLAIADFPFRLHNEETPGKYTYISPFFPMTPISSDKRKRETTR